MEYINEQNHKGKGIKCIINYEGKDNAITKKREEKK